jgi:hypothetical protein
MLHNSLLSRGTLFTQKLAGTFTVLYVAIATESFLIALNRQTRAKLFAHLLLTSM